MLGALAATLHDTIEHNRLFEAEVDKQLGDFDAATARGEQPKIPIYREPGSERPPTRVWDGVVSTGAAKALDPDLFYQLAILYTRLDPSAKNTFATMISPSSACCRWGQHNLESTTQQRAA